MAGFFTDSQVDQYEPGSLTASCRSCGLHKGCASPRMQPTGQGRRRVLVIAEAPGQDEDRIGRQLVGRAGQKLREHMAAIGVDLDVDCWKTNAVICRPPTNPNDKQIACCRPNVDRCIKEYQPEIIILLGERAVRSVIGPMWNDEIGGIGRWVGWRIPHRRMNTWICPTWHPSYLLRSNSDALELWFRRHLEAAFALHGRPYKSMPSDPADRVRCIGSPTDAANALREMMSSGSRFAFDFETNMLKPDSDKAVIHCCSVCNGNRSLAFPVQDEATTVLAEFLRSDAEKIGWNIKFEQRWSKRIFGHGVRGWWWDGMQASHILDNRPGITGLKFQSFVRLGIESYNRSVSKFLEADGSNLPNQISKANQADVLLYCGMDSLLTYRIAMQQRWEMGIENDSNNS